MTTISVNEVRTRLRSRRWIRAVAVGLLLFLTLGLITAWVALLAHRPRLTPLLTAVAVDYRWPVEPNAWVGEDLARLRSLHRESLRVTDLSADWRSRDLALRRLDQELTSLVTTRAVSDSVVFYFSLHGLVDANGRPHLLPTDASPTDPATWLPVSEVLDRICDILPSSVNKLVVLDSNRSASNWRIGQLHNTFADRLEGVIDRDRHPGLVILNSTSANQIGWSGPALTGSLFGQLLTRSIGTSGQGADLLDAGVGGRGGRKVRLKRLVDQINLRMDRWCRTHQLPIQTARLFPSDADDFSISWSLTPASVDRQFQRLALNGTPAVLPLDRDALWRQAGELPRRSLVSVVPEILNEVEQQLLWLEKLSASGSAYERQAKLHEAAVKRNLGDLTAALQDGATRLSPTALRASLFRETAGVRGANAVRSMPAPSLEVSATLGSLSADLVETSRRQWQDLITDLSAEQLKKVSEGFDQRWQTRATPAANGAATEDSEAVPSERAQSLKLLSRYRVLDRWSRRDPIVGVLRMQDESDRLSAMRGRDGAQEIRAADWLASIVTDADRQRWSVEDGLLAGPRTTDTDIDARLTSATQAYAAADQRLNEVFQAISICDDAFQRLAFFATWPDEWLTPDDDLVLNRVLPAMRDALTLGEQLDAISAGTPADAGAALPFREVAERLSATIRELDGQLKDRIRSALIAPEMSGETLLPLRVVLELPWIPWQDRREIRAVHDEISKSLALNLSAPPRSGEGRQPADRSQAELVQPTADGQAEGSSSVSQVDPRGGPNGIGPTGGGPNGEGTRTPLDRILSWSTHPAVLFLTTKSGEAGSGSPFPDGASGAESAIQQIEQSGALVRQALAALGQDAAASRTGSGYADRLSAARWQRRQLAFSAATFPVSPLELVWNERLQRWLMWHADRQLEAFVDLPPRPVGTGPRAPDFDRASERYLNLIALLGPTSAEVQQDIAALQRHRAARRLAARTGLVTDTKSSPIPPPVTSPTLDVIVGPGAGSDSTTDAFPPGRPSVWVQNQQRDPVTSVGLVDLPVRSPQTLSLQAIPSGLGESPRLTATTMFRGNEFHHPFVINRLAGPLVDFQPHVYGTSSVTLMGERRKRVSIMFVLDCSQSMEQTLPGESGNEVGPAKMDVAKSALLTMLDELSRQDGARIGVILLGHRIAWTRSDPPRLSRAPGADDFIPEGLLPSRDVETVLSLGRFDAGAVLRRLETTVPWGQTPLNLAVVEALRAFRFDDPDTEKNIIVITDGRDYQFTPNRGDIRQPPRTTQADVTRVAQEVGVPVFVIGLGVPDDERQAAESEYQNLARITGGETVSVDAASDLLRQIRGKLAPGTFSIDESGGKLVAPGANLTVNATLNSTVRVDPRTLAGNPAQLIFESATASLPLVGGEALQIRLSPDGRDFLPVPFDWQLPRSIGLATGRNDRLTPYVLRVHRPQAQGDHVSFPVSVQSGQAPMTSRPKDAWLVVTPLVDGAELSDHRYWFYDSNYEPDQPVPLLQWKAHGWPKQARSARLQFWCRFESTPALQEIPLQEVLNRPADFADYRLRDFPSIGLQVSLSDRGEATSDYLISVIQRHDSATPDLGQLRVEFRHGEGYRPSRVTHQFDATNGIVAHTYTFPIGDATGLERSEQSRFVLSSRAASQSQSLRPAGGQSIDIDIFGDADLIMINPAR
ncbi:MAG: VWA domain-containing protein [Planctomycetaceae bacterium]|nr:MAG: VWA domain-containing protein [Planctomycetaceae bacterium]